MELGFRVYWLVLIHKYIVTFINPIWDYLVCNTPNYKRYCAKVF